MLCMTDGCRVVIVGGSQFTDIGGNGDVVVDICAWLLCLEPLASRDRLGPV